MYAVESVSKRGSCSHSIEKTLADALEVVAVWIRAWLELGGCDKELAERIRGLFRESKIVEAMALWNDKSDDQLVTIHESKITKENCHHEALDAGDGIRFAVETTYNHPSHDLFVTHDEALAFVALNLARLSAEKHIMPRVRRRIRRLLHEGKRAEALDVWNRKAAEPKIAIHQIQLVKTNVQLDGR